MEAERASGSRVERNLWFVVALNEEGAEETRHEMRRAAEI